MIRLPLLQSMAKLFTLRQPAGLTDEHMRLKSTLPRTGVPARAALQCAVLFVAGASAAAAQANVAPAQALRSSQRAASPRDSLSAHMSAVAALRQFQYQFTIIVQDQERGTRTLPGVSGNCELFVYDFCYGPKNGSLVYGGFGTYIASGFLTLSRFHQMWRRGTENYTNRYLIELRRSQRTIPGDRWLNGEIVRIHLERGYIGHAESDLQGCRDASWWCDALAAYVMHASGAWAKSDSAWGLVLAKMTPDERCAWLEPAALIWDSRARRNLREMTCTQREQFVNRFWWLSDPLFVGAGNERRAAHLSRQMTLAIAEATYSRVYATPAMVRVGRVLTQHILTPADPDATLPGCGSVGDAEIQYYGDDFRFGYVDLVLRAGEPTYCAPGDMGTLAQYPLQRQSFVPDVVAAAHPVHALQSDWNLRDPWAHEFISGWTRTIFAMTHQAAWFAFDTTARLIIVAEHLPDTAVRSGTATDPLMLDAFLWLQADFDKPHTMHQSRGAGRVVFDVAVPPERTVASIEAILPGGQMTRVRAGTGPGWNPTQPRLISDVLLVDANVELPATLIEAARNALTTTQLKRDTTVTLFWELYGLQQGDTADMALTIAEQDGRHPRPVQSDSANTQTGTISLRWKEPPAAGLPVTGRAIRVTLAGLTRGVYSLSLAMVARGVRGQSVRTIEIVR